MSTTTSPAVAAYTEALTAADYPAAVAAYVAATSGDKARMRVAHQDAVKTAMMAASTKADIEAVKALMAVADDQSAAVGTKAPAPVDHDVQVAVFVAGVSLALSDVYDRYEADNEDVTLDRDKITELVEMALYGDSIPADVTAVADQVAAKIKVGRRTSAPGGDIAAHVTQALAIIGGPALVSTIANTPTDEYPEGAPSDGAISARLFPRDGKACTIEGVVPCMVDGKKGARLA